METGGQLYISQRISVPTEFEEVFTHFYVAENHAKEPIQKTLLPSFQTILVFNFGAAVILTSNQNTNIALDKCLVLGPVKQPIGYTLSVGTKILVANFKADAFYRFFGEVILTAGLPVHPDELLDENCFTTLWNNLQGIGSSTEQVKFILDFCKPYLKNRDTILGQITDFTNENKSLNPVKAIAQQTNQSERTIQLKHKKYLGYSAKEIARYQRFLKAIELVEISASGKKSIDWFEIIDRCNYYDQSQLIHDFRHFLHLSPTQFLRFQEDICIARSE